LEKEQLKYLKGTTTIGLACKDGVVLATDTRATAGYLIASKRARKIYKITNHIGVTVAGGVGDTQGLVRMLRAEANYYQMREGVPMDVRAAAKLTANILHAYRLFPYLALLIIAGVDESGPSLYLVSLDGSMIEESKVATGSGSPVAHGVLEGEFEEGMEVEKALSIAVKALEAAIKRDIGTGNEIRVATLTEAGYRELSPGEIAKRAA
jgi:proteasome beta subunit